MCASLPSSRAFGRINRPRLPTNGGLVFFTGRYTHPKRKGVLEDDESLLGVQAEGLGVTAVKVSSCPRLTFQLGGFGALVVHRTIQPPPQERVSWRTIYPFRASKRRAWV